MSGRSGRVQFSLRAGERIFVNGAVLKVDRKVSIEFLNDVTFLLESHVLQPNDTDTPLKQLYFVVQTMLIEPSKAAQAQTLYWKMHASLSELFRNGAILGGLERSGELMRAGKTFEALRTIRGLFALEAEVLGRDKRAATPAA